MALVHFLESSAGRIARMAAGLALIGLGVGLSIAFGGAWWVVAAVGVVPFAAGLFGVCLLAPLFHEPLVHHTSHAR